MRNKYLSFAKNLGISAVAGLAAGAGAASLSSLVTDNHTITAVSSTIAEYAAAYSVFLPLHVRDNRDIYTREDGKFNWKLFVGDQIKLGGGFFVLDVAYLIGRPYLAKEFLQSGAPPAQASLYADLISYPSLFLAAFPLAKIIGIIRSENPASK